MSIFVKLDTATIISKSHYTYMLSSKDTNDMVNNTAPIKKPIYRSEVILQLFIHVEW
jgi:hypothetical protein